jgi:membrane protease subunit (stomatin/prohibitin family)
MGFIKAIGDAAKGQHKDLFREIIKCDDMATNVIAKRVSTENNVISDQSRLFVQPGQAAIYVDNGAIKDIITEPGMYFMDTSAPTLFQTNIFKGVTDTVIETLKRIAYEGKEINQQFVYYISLTEKIGLPFKTEQKILYDDPEWGPMELSAHGQYAFKVENPINILVNLLGNESNDIYVEDLSYSLLPFIVSSITSEIANLNVPFEEITKQQDKLGENILPTISEKITSLGIEITKIVVTNIDVPEEIKVSMRERVGIKMKATSVDEKEVDTYAKIQQADALKDLANNPGSAGTTVMGMNVGGMFGGVLTGENKTENNQQDNK